MPHRVPSKRQREGEEHWRNKSSDVSSEVPVRSITPQPSPQSRLMEKVRSMFSWIAGRVAEEAREEESGSVVEAAAKRLLSQYSSRDLIRRAESSIAQLELSKQVLLQEFGSRAQAFVDRYIDPIIEPVKSFVQESHEGKTSEHFKGAVGNVELLAILHDDTRLSRRIRETLETKTKDVILEDIAFILSYPSEALEDASIPASQRAGLLRNIEEALQPVLLDLEALLSVRSPSYEFIPLFQWRAGVDLQRQHLHDKAMQIIEEKVHTSAPLWRSLSDLPPQEIKVYLEGLESFSEKDRSWPLSLFELEEISSHLREIVEGQVVSRQDEKLLQLFAQVRTYVEALLESEEGDVHEDALLRIVDQVRAIEALLGIQHTL